jgi:hypothetical protein
MTLPTLEEAMAYVAKTECKWGQLGLVERFAYHRDDAYGVIGWDIWTAENYWTVWYEPTAQGGRRIYGEC